MYIYLIKFRRRPITIHWLASRFWRSLVKTWYLTFIWASLNWDQYNVNVNAKLLLTYWAWTALQSCCILWYSPCILKSCPNPMYCKRQPCLYHETHLKFTNCPVCGLLNGNSVISSSWLGSENSPSTIFVQGPKALSPISMMKSFTPLKWESNGPLDSWAIAQLKLQSIMLPSWIILYAYPYP